MKLKTASAVAGLLLAGCNAGGSANDAAPNQVAPAPTPDAITNKAPTPLPPPAANAASPAPDLEGARVLIGQIYMPYTRGQIPRLPNIYTPELRRAIDRQDDGDGTGLGYDPFCRCQDFENFRYTIQSVERRDQGARAVVAFTNMGESHNVTLLLDYRNDRWLVADVQEGRDSLLTARR